MHERNPHEPWQLPEAYPPIPGESYNGYVARVAAAEGYPTTFVLHRLAGLELPQRTELAPSCVEGLPELARTLRIDPAELESRSHRALSQHRRTFGGVGLERGVLDLGTRRFSPASIAKSGHHRALWCLRPFPFCDESWELLTNRCPSPHCSVVQRFYYPAGVPLCDRCGEPLTGATTGMVDPALRGALRLAVGLLHHEPSRREASEAALPDAVRQLPPGGAFAMLLACARVWEPAIKSRRHMFDANVEPARMARVMAEAWELLAGWPESIERLAADRIAVRRSRQGDGNGRATLALLLGNWHRDVPGVTPLVSAMRERFEENARTCPDVKSVLKSSGTKARDLAKFRREGRVDTVFGLDGGRAVPLVTPQSADRLAAKRRASDLVEEVATRTGLPIYGVEQACALGLLDWWPDPLPCAVRSGVRIATASVEAMTAALERAASRDDFAGQPIGEVMLGVGGRLKPWGPLVEALIAGRVRFRVSQGGSTKPLMRRILIETADLELARSLVFEADQAFPFRTHLTRFEASEVLNMKASCSQKAIAQWPAVSSGRPVVPLIELENLATRWVPAVEIAQRFWLTTMGTRLLLEEAGVPRSSAGFDRVLALSILMDVLNEGGIEASATRIGQEPRTSAKLLRKINVGHRPAGGDARRVELGSRKVSRGNRESDPSPSETHRVRRASTDARIRGEIDGEGQSAPGS